MQYFSKTFTMNHIVNNLELPSDIQVYSRNKRIVKAKMVMSKSKVKGKGKGGAMITKNWSSVVDANHMRVCDIFSSGPVEAWMVVSSFLLTLCDINRQL